MGAGGRDFPNFNVAFREDPDVEVVAFTAEQTPGIKMALRTSDTRGVPRAFRAGHARLADVLAPIVDRARARVT